MINWLRNRFRAQGYDAGETGNRQRKDLGWGRRAPRDEDSLIGRDGSREMIRQRCADLRRNNAIVAGICRRVSAFVVGEGIIPQARTRDRGWNRDAEEWWRDWSRRCDYTGRLTLSQIQGQAVGLRPTHGGVYLERLADGSVRLIEAERIRQPRKKENQANTVDGVRVDPATGRAVAYCVWSRDKDGQFGTAAKESWVAAEDIQPVLSPFWRPDQIREIPDLAPVVPHIQDIHEMNQYTLNTAKLQSMVMGFLKKQGGLGLNSLPRGSTPTSPGERQVFKFNWGEILEGFPGDDLDMKVSPTPNGQHIAYMQLQLGLCAAALDFPYEFFTLDFSKCDYSRFKGVLLWVNKTCRGWRQWLNDSLNARLWNWRIAMAIRDGELGAAPNDARGKSEWSRVEWQAPEELWVDRQESNQADMLEWQLGLGSLAKAAKRRGADIEDLLREKAETMKLAAQIEIESGIPAGTLIQAQIPGQTVPGQAAAPAPATNAEPEEKTDE